MSRSTIGLTKFVGSISLGLLTGVSYALSTLTLPPLLLLPSATQAHAAFLSLQSSTKRHQRTLSAISITSLTLSYLLSPRRGRHPYLLWTALMVGVSGGVDFLLRHDERELREAENINGEMVREGMERWRAAQWARTGVAGMGFAMSVVGIWGDGF